MNQTVRWTRRRENRREAEYQVYHRVADLWGPFAFLAVPHGQQLFEVLILLSLILKGVQDFSQHVLRIHVATFAQEGADGADELGVDMAGEGGARMVGQDPDEHDGIVLGVLRLCGLGEVVANQGDGLFGSSRGGLGGLNDGGEVQEVIALLTVDENKDESKDKGNGPEDMMDIRLGEAR
jgi:hypothetical protein